MAEINSYINPSPRTLATAGNVALPIEWGEGHQSLEMGGFLEAVDSAGTAIATDSAGHKYIRAGSVLVKTANEWRLLAAITDTEGSIVTTVSGDVVTETPAADGRADEIMDATAVGILKQTADVLNGGGLVGIYIAGGFFAARMPSIAANATPGLEATARAALTARGFKFSEDYH